MPFTDIFMTQVLTFQERGGQAEPPGPQAPSHACQRASCGPRGRSLAEPYSQTRLRSSRQQHTFHEEGLLSRHSLPSLPAAALYAKRHVVEVLTACRAGSWALGRAGTLLWTLPISRVLSSAVESDRRNAVRE